MASITNGHSNGSAHPDTFKPWLSYPHELPSASTPLHSFPEFSILSSASFVSSLHSEVRANVLSASRSAFPSTSGAAILLMGGRSADFELYDSDSDKCEFRQEMFFRYVFGLNEPDCFGAIDLERGESLLFVPEVSDDSQRWNGERRPLSFYSERYAVQSTHLTTELHSTLQARGLHTLYVLHGVNLDSDLETKTTAEFPELRKYTVNATHLHPLLSELRVFKTLREQQVMRLGNAISSQAHVYVMRHIKAGMTEVHLEGLFKAYCYYFGGARHMAYTCICGSGANGSILHYGHAGRPNDRVLRDGDAVVLDMGGEYIGYTTDITRSYPVNGKFTADQAAIHTAVYEAQTAVLRAMKPGVSWPDMHRLAERVIVTHLLRIGILHGGSVDDCMAAHLGAVFMPHGLGHLLGMNVHDVGGYHPGSSRSKEPGLCWLRCGRKLEAGMVVTVEPGVYFNEPTLQAALQDSGRSRYINAEVLARFRGTGGCRLEDDVLVTKDGAENLTVIPATVEEIEEVMAAVGK